MNQIDSTKRLLLYFSNHHDSKEIQKKMRYTQLSMSSLELGSTESEGLMRPKYVFSDEIVVHWFQICRRFCTYTKMLQESHRLKG